MKLFNILYLDLTPQLFFSHSTASRFRSKVALLLVNRAYQL